MQPSDPAAYQLADVHHSPFIVFYELTRACELSCRHCRACAQPRRHPRELPGSLARALLEQLATFPHRPMVVLTGGDPFMRPDLFDLAAHARTLGLRPSVAPSATPRVTPDALRRLKSVGVERIALSLDASDARTHDAIRGVPGSFDRTIALVQQARLLGLEVQINSTVQRCNHDQFDRLGHMLATLDIALWSVFFLVPVGRAGREGRIRPMQYEQVFDVLHRHAARGRFAVKTTEAPHYRRFVAQHAVSERPMRPASPGRGPLGLNDGKGVMFISHTGHVYPSGFLPQTCGRFPRESVVEVYQQHPLMRALRDPDRLKGKCSACDYRSICGGSRARAFAVTRDPLAAEPDCCYLPPDWSPPAFSRDEDLSLELLPC